MLGALFNIVGLRGIIGLAAGLAIMGAWERAPWGLQGRLTASEHLSDHRAAELKKAASALRIASQGLRERDQAILDNANQERDDATDAARFWRGQCKAAFDAGYASRRCDGQSVAGGVRSDLRGLVEAGAWRPSSGGLPGGSDSGDRPGATTP